MSQKKEKGKGERKEKKAKKRKERLGDDDLRRIVFRKSHAIQIRVVSKRQAQEIYLDKTVSIWRAGKSVLVRREEIGEKDRKK